jgi:hypothetical protein
VVARHRGAIVQLVVADVAREDDVARLFKTAGPVDHVVLTRLTRLARTSRSRTSTWKPAGG